MDRQDRLLKHDGFRPRTRDSHGSLTAFPRQRTAERIRHLVRGIVFPLRSRRGGAGMTQRRVVFPRSGRRFGTVRQRGVGLAETLATSHPPCAHPEVGPDATEGYAAANRVTPLERTPTERRPHLRPWRHAPRFPYGAGSAGFSAAGTMAGAASTAGVVAGAGVASGAGVDSGAGVGAADGRFSTVTSPDFGL